MRHKALRNTAALVAPALLVAAFLTSASTPARAQFGGMAGGQAGTGALTGAEGGLFDLPPGVTKIVSIDAHNLLMLEIERDGRRFYQTLPVRHVYSGGIARLFIGGAVVPTELFVSPGLAGRAAPGQGAGQGAGQGFGAQGFGGGQGFGGQGFGGNVAGRIN